MFHVVLFTCMSLLFGLFAITAAGAGQLVVAVAAGALALWAAESVVRSLKRLRANTNRIGRSTADRP